MRGREQRRSEVELTFSQRFERSATRLRLIFSNSWYWASLLRRRRSYSCIVEARYWPSLLLPVDTAVSARLSSSTDCLYSSIVLLSRSISDSFDSTCSLRTPISPLSRSSWSLYFASNSV